MTTATQQQLSPLIAHQSQEALRSDVHDAPVTSSALLFHTQGPAGRLAFVTAHSICHDDQLMPHLGPGRPLTPTDEYRVLSLLTGQDDRAVEIYSEHTLAKTSQMVMWWLPPSVRPMYLKPIKGAACTVDVHWPSLVAMVVGRTLFLVAVAGDQRPDASTALYHAPLANVFADSRVCTGSARLPQGCALDDVAMWNVVIGETYFTHDNHDQVMVTLSGKPAKARNNYAATTHWAKRDGNAAPFPDKRLVAMKRTLSQWANEQLGVQR